MTPPAPLSPERMKAALERSGYKCIDETDHNWLFRDTAAPDALPISIPKGGRCLDPQIMSDAFGHSGRAARGILDELQRNGPCDPGDDP